MKIVLGVDPGQHKSGYCIIDLSNWEILGSGHASWEWIRQRIRSDDFAGLAFEDIVIYIHGKMGKMNILNVVPVIEEIGRMKQVCEDERLEYRSDIRSEVIKTLTGRAPSRTNKVSKAEMQKVVKDILGLEKVVRPQHANDALCVLIAKYHPNYNSNAPK